MKYTQDFNTFPASPDNTFAAAAWSDDTTLQGWYFYRAGNGAGSTIAFAGNAFTWRVTDGSLQTAQTNNLINTGWFYSMGTATGTPTNSDRAPGAVPITAQGELSYLADFQNTGAHDSADFFASPAASSRPQAPAPPPTTPSLVLR